MFQLLLCLAVCLIVGKWYHFFTDSAVSPVVKHHLCCYSFSGCFHYLFTTFPNLYALGEYFTLVVDRGSWEGSISAMCIDQNEVRREMFAFC